MNAQATVILSTYNHPVWLQKVLCGYAGQDEKRFEIVVADDGSDHRTADVIRWARAETNLRIEHVWHPDNGFQKCEILNRGILAASTDYLIFSDGDCVPRGDFVAQHLNHRRKGCFLSGGYYKLPMSLSRQMTLGDIETGSAFSLRYLRRGGVRPSARDLRVVTSGWASAICNAVTTTRATWNGNNSSGWKTDLLFAGGFDTRMRYGGQDRELGERLVNAGLRGRHIRFQTLVLHLDHARGYANPVDRERNLQIRAETRQSGATQTRHGLPLDESALPPLAESNAA